MSRTKTLDELKSLAEERDDPVLRDVASWLSAVRERLEQVDGRSIKSAIAFGSALTGIEKRGTRTRSRWGSERYLEVLIATPKEDTFDLEDELAEHVFGPIFFERGHLPSVHVWSLTHVQAEREARSPFWKSLEQDGVLLTGDPLW